MAVKNKTFDCVASKRQAQRRLQEEYRARKDHFASYADFLSAIVMEDPWARSNWERFAATAPS